EPFTQRMSTLASATLEPSRWRDRAQRLQTESRWNRGCVIGWKLCTQGWKRGASRSTAMVQSNSAVRTHGNARNGNVSTSTRCLRARSRSRLLRRTPMALPDKYWHRRAFQLAHLSEELAFASERLADHARAI